jgi:hypothetical protein
MNAKDSESKRGTTDMYHTTHNWDGWNPCDAICMIEHSGRG